MKPGALIAMALLCLFLTASCGGGGTQAPDGADRPPASSEAGQSGQTPEQSEPDTALPPEEDEEAPAAQPDPELPETDTAEDFYRACTSLPARKVEGFALRVREAFLARDWAALSEDIAYPITVGEVCCEDAAAFRAGDFSALDQSFYDALEAERCRELFCNWQGIMLGGGQVWIGEDGAGELKVTAINP